MGIGKYGDTPDGGQHLLEDPESFGHQVEVKEERPRDVAARPSEAGDVAERHRVVVDAHHDDGNRGGRFLGGTSRGRRIRDDEADVKMDEISRKGRKPLVLAVGAPVLEGDVLTLHVSEITQRLS